VLVAFFSCEGAICRGNLIARWGRLLNLVRVTGWGDCFTSFAKTDWPRAIFTRITITWQVWDYEGE
jgi:hypothetical protein